MTDSLDELKRDYRRIKAPPYLVTRVAASAREQERRTRGRPAMVAAALVLAVVAVLPFTRTDDADRTVVANAPSLSRLAALKPSRPDVSAPSLSNLRSPRRPPLPRKPSPTPEPPQPEQDSARLYEEETNHAHI